MFYRSQRGRTKSLSVLIQEEFGTQDPLVLDLLSVIDGFDKRMSNFGDVNVIVDAIEATERPQLKRYIADIAMASYIRDADARAFRAVRKGISSSDLDINDPMTCRITEKDFSFAITSMNREFALAPDDWQMEDLLDRGNALMRDGAGLKIMSDGAPRTFLAPDIGSFEMKSWIDSRDVPGIYIMFWSIFYFMSNPNLGESAFEYADKLLAYLRKYPDRDFSRQIWNMSFFCAMQAHRRGNIELRNKFLQPNRVEDQREDFLKRLEVLDNVAVGYAIFLCSIDNFPMTIDAYGLAHVLINNRDRIGQGTYRNAVDSLRKQARIERVYNDIFRAHYVSDDMFSLYRLSPREIVRGSTYKNLHRN